MEVEVEEVVAAAEIAMTTTDHIYSENIQEAIPKLRVGVEVGVEKLPHY